MTRRAVLLDAQRTIVPQDGTLHFVLNRWEPHDSHFISLPEKVDQAAEPIQAGIASWISTTKSAMAREIRVTGSDLDPLIADMNPCFEGNYATTPEFYLLAQLMALVFALEHADVSELSYLGDDSRVSACLGDWCNQRGIAFEFAPQLIKPISGLRNYLSAAKRLLRVMALGIRNTMRATAVPTDVSYVLIDYLVMNPIRTYWGPLLSILPTHPKTLCVHNFAPHDAIPSIWGAFKHMRRVRSSEPSTIHLLPDELICIRDYFPIWKTYQNLVAAWHVFSTEVQPRLPRPYGLQPALLLGNRLRMGWRGSAAVDTATQLVIFDRLSEVLGETTKVFYLQENHTWEKTMLYHFHKRSERIVGVSHTAVRPLDLRYQFIARDFADYHRLERLLPNRIASNGEISRRFLEARIDQSFLVDVEALRFMSLSDTSPRDMTTPHIALIAGDLQPSHSEFVLRTAIFPLKKAGYKLIFKPHPADRGSLSIATEFGIEVSNEPISVLLGKCAIIVVGSITAACVEAAQLGIPIVTVVDPNYFNLSPLRDSEVSSFAYSSQQVSDSVRSIREFGGTQQFNFLCLDKSLSRWRQLLVE